MRTCAYKWDAERIQKLVIRSARTKLMFQNKSNGLFFVHWSGQVP